MLQLHHLPDQLMRRGLLLRLAAYLTILVLLTNLNAIVDAVLHPEIPYFDEEHVIVGGATASTFLLLLCLLEMYFYRLRKALDRLNSLEKFLAICSYCRKVRIPEADPKDREAWMPMESYLQRHRATQLSHGLCPDCLAAHYGDILPDPAT